jgi:hypothetical protein
MAGRFVLRFGRRPPVDSVPPEASAPAADEAPPPPPPPRPLPPHRERRELARRREIEIRDVGGLALEMARRDDWRYPLLRARTAEVLAIEERLHELDAHIAAAEIAARGVGAVECECGAPILRGSHFCANCGRPAQDTAPVVTCSHCGQPLAAETNFCPVCGNAVAAEAFGGDIEDTFVAPAPGEEPSPGAPR